MLQNQAVTALFGAILPLFLECSPLKGFRNVIAPPLEHSQPQTVLSVLFIGNFKKLGRYI